MDKLSYTDFIKIYEDMETINLIGKIDTEFLNENRIECLYYIFPLIERIVLEIYKLVPEADVEHFEQGTMRTIKSLIDNNKDLDVLPKYINELVIKYYGDNGIRNELFHVKNSTIKVEIDFNELNYLIMKLVLLLKNRINEYDKFEIKEIAYL